MNPRHHVLSLSPSLLRVDFDFLAFIHFLFRLAGFIGGFLVRGCQYSEYPSDGRKTFYKKKVLPLVKLCVHLISSGSLLHGQNALFPALTRFILGSVRLQLSPCFTGNGSKD